MMLSVEVATATNQHLEQKLSEKRKQLQQVIHFVSLEKTVL